MRFFVHVTLVALNINQIFLLPLVVDLVYVRLKWNSPFCANVHKKYLMFYFHKKYLMLHFTIKIQYFTFYT